MVLAKEKKGYILYCLFCRKKFFFNICVLFQCSMYNVLNILSDYTYFYISKTLLRTLFCLFLKSSIAFSVSLIKSTLDKDFFIVKIDFWINRLEDSYVMMIQPFFDCSFSVWFPNLRKDSLIVCFVYNCRRRHGWEQLNLQKLTS